MSIYNMKFIVVIAFMVVTVVGAKVNNQGIPDQILNLQQQIDTIELTPGPVGPQGPAGVDGAIGPEGSQGSAGVDGAIGPAGPQGPAGVDGAIGAEGPQGSAGVDGATGPAGPQGPAGVDGATGPEGPQGPAGVDGATGPEGPQGPAGVDGATGPAGPQGPVGVDGIVGPAGPQGPAGVDGATGSVDLLAREAVCLLYDEMGMSMPEFCLSSDKVVFVTKNIYDGNLGGIAGADAKCQEEAVAANLSGTFLAWIASNADNDPESVTRITRLYSGEGTGNYVNTADQIVAESWGDLTDGHLSAAIEYTADGTSPPLSMYAWGVWTNVNHHGTIVSSMANCNDWMSGAPSLHTFIGHHDSINQEWTLIDGYSPGGDCDNLNRLYCMQK